MALLAYKKDGKTIIPGKITTPKGSSSGVDQFSSAPLGSQQRSDDLYAAGQALLNKPKGQVAGASTGPKVSTTTISNNNKMQQIPSMVEKATNYANGRGVTTDPNTGTATYADGSIYDPEEKDTSTDEESINKDFDRQANDVIEQMKKNTDSSLAESLGSIQSKFAYRKAQQQRINSTALAGTRTALLMGGITGQGSTAQFAPLEAGGTIQAQESYGLQQLANLDMEEQDLIFQAKAAADEQNYRTLEKKLAEIEDKRKEKLDTAAKINEEARKTNEAMQKDMAISDLYSAGVTDTGTALKELKRLGVKATAKEVSDTISLLSGVGGSGIVGEYNFYKADAKAHGQVPVDFNTYQNMDANRKKSIAAAGVAGSGGVSPTNGTTSTDANKALQIILGSAKFTKDQKADVINAIKNGADPFTVVKNQAKSIMSGANQTKLEAAETSRNAFNELADSIKAFYDAGGDTSYVKGNFEKMYNRFGQVKNPKLVDLAVQIQGNIQSYRNAISGTAYSEQEGRDIASIFPGINRSEGLNNAIISGRKKLFDTTIDATYRGTLGSIYDDLKSAEGSPKSKTVAEDLIQVENDAKSRVINYGKTNPKFQPIILKKVNEINPYTGQKFTYQELLEIYPEMQ